MMVVGGVMTLDIVGGMVGVMDVEVLGLGSLALNIAFRTGTP